MRYRHIMQLLCITLPICVILKTVQMIFVIDSTTGFLKQQYSTIGILISVIICATVGAVGLLAYTVNEIKLQQKELRPGVAAASILAGGIFIFAAVSNIADLNVSTFYDVALMLLSIAAAFSFLAYGLKNIYTYNMPSVIMTLPTVYYILNLINIFIGKSKLATVTDNIFTIITNCVLLLFMFEFGCVENNIGETDKKQKKILAYGAASVMMCITTAVPKLISVMISDKVIYRADIANALLNLAVSAFIMAYIYNYSEPKQTAPKATPKHQA